jgi:phage-related protein
MAERKPLVWVGSTRTDLTRLPAAVQRVLGYALHLAQIGEKHPDAKPLKGFGGAGVLEVVEDCDGSTYRAVYTVRLAERVYVLHAFQKKSKKGITTPNKELQIVRRRLREAEEIHAAWLKESKS